MWGGYFCWSGARFPFTCKGNLGATSTSQDEVFTKHSTPSENWRFITTTGQNIPPLVLGGTGPVTRTLVKLFHITKQLFNPDVSQDFARLNRSAEGATGKSG